jgi:hypothetical protein
VHSIGGVNNFGRVSTEPRYEVKVSLPSSSSRISSSPWDSERSTLGALAVVTWTCISGSSHGARSYVRIFGPRPDKRHVALSVSPSSLSIMDSSSACGIGSTSFAIRRFRLTSSAISERPSFVLSAFGDRSVVAFRGTFSFGVADPLCSSNFFNIANTASCACPSFITNFSRAFEKSLTSMATMKKGREEKVRKRTMRFFGD